MDPQLIRIEQNVDLYDCYDYNCKCIDHRIALDDLCNSLIECCLKACTITIPEITSGITKEILGWNDLATQERQQSLFWHWIWCECGKPYNGARKDVIRQLERLQRQAARVTVVCKKKENDHNSVTELMWGLHWLPIHARIQYKILLLVYKAFTSCSPTYLADMMTSYNPVRSTRSSHKVNLLVVPHQKSNKYSEKAFAVVGPRLWNELLTDELRGCNSVDTFKKS